MTSRAWSRAGGPSAALSSPNSAPALTPFVRYQAHRKEIGRVWREFAGSVYPAMAGIGCTALWQPEAMIEILGVAVIPGERVRRGSHNDLKALVIGGWSRSLEIAAGAGGRLAGVRFPWRAGLWMAGPPGSSSAAIAAARQRM
jgi:hypothetical protein